MSAPTPVEANLFALFRAMVDVCGGELLASPTGCRHLAPLPNPLFAGAWATAPDPTPDQLAETIAWFDARGCPAWFWWQPTFEAAPHGLTEPEPGGTAVMEADVAALDPTLPLGVAVDEVLTDADAEAFVDVLVAAYRAPPAYPRSWIDATRRAGFGRAPWRLWLAREHGVPVATNITFDGAGVVGLFAVGTVPKARGRGLGGAVTVAPLLAEGSRRAVLFASPDGERLYERLGFLRTGQRIRRHLRKR